MSEPAKHLVKLIGFPYETGAAHVVAALDAAGIRSVTDGTATAGFRAEAPGEIRVMIAERNLAQAKQILEEVQQGTSDIDWLQVDVGDPEKESLEFEQSKTSFLGSPVWKWCAIVVVVLVAVDIVSSAIAVVSDFVTRATN